MTYEIRENILTFSHFFPKWPDHPRQIRIKKGAFHSPTLHLPLRRSSSSVPVWWAQVKEHGHTRWARLLAFLSQFLTFVRPMPPSVMTGNLYSGQNHKDRQKRKQRCMHICKCGENNDSKWMKQSDGLEAGGRRHGWRQKGETDERQMGQQAQWSELTKSSDKRFAVKNRKRKKMMMSGESV